MEQVIPDEEVLAFGGDEKLHCFDLNCKHFVRLHATYPWPHLGLSQS